MFSSTTSFLVKTTILEGDKDVKKGRLLIRAIFRKSGFGILFRGLGRKLGVLFAHSLNLETLRVWKTWKLREGISSSPFNSN